MKIFITTLVITLMFNSHAFAKGDHQHDGGPMDHKSPSHMMQCGTMDKMNPEQKMAMKQRMKKMKSTMKKIHAETDIKKREKLMQEQLGYMEDCMGMMEKMMGNHDKSKSGHKHKGS